MNLIRMKQEMKKSDKMKGQYNKTTMSKIDSVFSARFSAYFSISVL